MNPDAVLLWLAVGLYGLGLALTVPSVARRRPLLSPSALGVLGLGLGFHAASLAAQAAEIHRLPITDVRSALSSFTFLATLAFFLVYLRYRIASLGLFMLPLVLLLTLLSALRAGSSFESPAFRSGWLLVHIASILLGYVCFFLTFVARLIGNWGGRRSAALAIFGFVAVLVTFLGISMWSGLHGYFPNLGGGN